MRFDEGLNLKLLGSHDPIPITIPLSAGVGAIVSQANSKAIVA
jgi:hypothetical protein